MRKTLLFVAALSCAAGAALAQQQPLISDGSDYRPMQVNVNDLPAVRQGAIDAARASNGAGSEGVGTSTPPAMTTGEGGELAHQGAVDAARMHNGMGTESIGSSTAPRMSGS